MTSKGTVKINPEEYSDLFVVGVGASAGGLDALSKFLSNFSTEDHNFCVVVVMHLSPDYKSELTNILGKRCKWNVITVTQDVELLEKHVYVTPQNKNILIEHNHLKLETLPAVHTSAPSIDSFFSSLAMSKKEHAIGIVLSGFGSDGSLGISKIHKNLGFTMAQLPETAEHKDMPKSAIATDCITKVLPSEQMFKQIVEYINRKDLGIQTKFKKGGVDAIFELLEKHSGTDFSLYKPSTIMRRITHRMNALQINSIGNYHEMILSNPKELESLFYTVLIGVTEFFRDPKSFVALKKELQTILKDKSPGDSIRIWSVGCATGEEPYSIAILLNELLGSDINKYHIQIFATDIDEKALFLARKGVYATSSISNLSDDLKSKYFEKTDDKQYELKKQVKQHILFTRHNIGSDPPFVKLDLISCRNLLIYFSNELQKQTFQIFHYALRPKGILFLGKSESVSVAADLFKKKDAQKIYQKIEASLNYQLRFSRFKAKEQQNAKHNTKEYRNLSISDVAKETLYYKYDHPFVIINEQADIKEVHGSLRLYLEISEGAMNANIFKMVNKELSNSLKAILTQVKKTKVQHKSHAISFKLYEQDHYVRLKVIPLIHKVVDQQLFIVIFEKIKPNNQLLEFQKKMDTSDFVNHRINALEEELASSREHLQIFTEELETTNEELQTINEELQSANEELKSTNEELETANEELQSANEELNTANNELRLTNENLVEKEEELKLSKLETQKNMQMYRSIAEHTPQGSVGIVNKQGIIENVNGKIFDILDLNPKELIGKSFINLNPSVKERKKIKSLLEKTFTEEHPQEEISYSNRIFNIQTVPIKLFPNEETKIMFLSQDITERRIDEIKLKTAIKAAKIVIYEYNYKTDEFKTNPPFRELLGYDKAIKLTKKTFLDRIHDDDLEEIRLKSEEAYKSGVLAYEARLKGSDPVQWIRVFGRIVFDDKNVPEFGIATILDITKDREYLRLLKERERHFRVIADSVPVIIWVTDIDKKCIFLNKTFHNYVGGNKEEHLGNGWAETAHPEDRAVLWNTYNDAFDSKKEFSLEYRMRDKFGNYSWFLVHGNPLINLKGEFEGFIGSCVDISNQKTFRELLEQRVTERTLDLKMSNEKLKQANLHLEEFAYIASHDLQEPLRKIRVFNSLLKESYDNDEDFQNYMLKIEDSAARLAKLITNILQYGQIIESEDAFAIVQINDIVEDIKVDLELIINDRNANITSKNLGEINGDRMQLYQLFSNLIKNALKFNDQNEPSVQIKRKQLAGSKLPASFDNAKDLDYALFTVKDNGIGIKADAKREVFKPFKQLNAKSNYPGTGIGLAICKKIVEAHKGYIDVRNNRDKGVTFYVYLPIKT